jgi:hypothetical protein
MTKDVLQKDARKILISDVFCLFLLLVLLQQIYIDEHILLIQFFHALTLHRESGNGDERYEQLSFDFPSEVRWLGHTRANKKTL